MSNNSPKENYWIALVLSMLVVISWPWIMNKMYPQAKQPVTETGTEKTPLVPPAEVMAALKAEVEKAAAPAPATVPYSNRLYDIHLSTLGGSITQLVYKGESAKTHLAEVPFYLGAASEPGLFAVRVLHDEIDTTLAVFQLNRKSDSVFEFVYEKPGQYRFTKQYSIQEDSPVILLDMTFENLLSGEKTFPLEMKYGLYYADTPAANHHDVQTLFYQEKPKTENLDKVKKKGFTFGGEGIEWLGNVKRYFTVLLKPDWKILGGDSRADNDAISSTARFEPFTVGPASKVTKRVFIYAGPQRYETLKNIDQGFEEILSKGFFGLFKIWLLIGLKFFNQFTQNFGWAIILLTIAIKLLFTPLTHMSYESMRKMQAIQPKLKSLQERHKNDPQKLNREMMELYKRNKVNPMGGCLPMLAQIPIFIAFYQVLSETIELKGAPFIFWMHDLAAPDRLFQFPFSIPLVGDAFNLLPFFMIASMVWQQQLTPQPSSSPEQAKIMQWMPVMMGVLFYHMPAGLVLYWFVNNMLTVFHQLVIKRMGAVVLHHEDRD